MYSRAVPPKEGEGCAYRVLKSKFDTRLPSTVIPRNHSDPEVTMTSGGTKRCSRCDRRKPLDAFSKFFRGHQGRQAVQVVHA